MSLCLQDTKDGVKNQIDSVYQKAECFLCRLHFVENNGAVAIALHRKPLASPPCGTLLWHFSAVVSYSASLGKGAARIKMSDRRVPLQPYWENQSVRATAKASRSIKYTAWRSL